MIFPLLISIVFFALIYRYFGRFLDRRCGTDDSRATPAYTQQHGVDYVPTRAPFLSVSCGTISKQLKTESDTRRVNYGTMLVKGGFVTTMSVRYVLKSD